MIGGKIKLWVIIGSLLIASFIAWGKWSRYDAERDLRATLAAENAEERLEHIKEDRERDQEIDALGDDDLRRRALEWVR